MERAGMMPIYKLPSEETGTNEGSITPAPYILTEWILFGNMELPSEFEIDQPSRQIGIACPLVRASRRAASTRIVPRSAAGSSHRVRGQELVGEATSAGAVNSQSCLCAATRPTMTAYRIYASRDCLPSLCFALSESSICL